MAASARTKTRLTCVTDTDSIRSPMLADENPTASPRLPIKTPTAGDAEGSTTRAAPARILLRWLTLGYTAFVIYGSLVPLRFRPRPLADAWESFQRIPYLELGIGSRADWVANILLFVPLAFLWLGVLWPKRGWIAKGLASALVLFCCVGLSVAIEFTQNFFPPRTVSLNDVIAESIGAVIGIGLWWSTGSRVMGWLAGWSQAHTPTGTAGRLLYAYLFLLFGYSIMPLDLTISAVEIYHKWQEGKVLLVPFSAVYETGAQRAYALLADIAIWIPAAFLWKLSSSHSARKVVLYVVACATTIEVLQLFVYSRVTSTTDVLTAGCGGVIGVALAGWLRPGTGTPSSPRSIDFGSGWVLLWILALAGWAGVLMVVFWYPFDFNTDWRFVQGRLPALKRVPFEAYYYGTEFRALTEVFHKAGFFFPLGVLLAIGVLGARRLVSLPSAIWYAGGTFIIAGAAIGIEAGQLLLPGKNADLTDVFLEALGAMIGFVAILAYFEPLRASAADRRASSEGEKPGRHPQGSARQFLATAQGEVRDSPDGRRVGTWSRYGWLWGAVVMVGLVWVATHSALAPYNLRKLVQTRVPLFSVAVLVAATYWTLGVPVSLAGKWMAANRHSVLLAALSVLGYGFGAWLLFRLAVPLEMIEKVVGSPVLGWPLEFEDVGRFVALFCVPALAGIGASLFVGFSILHSRKARIARATWLLMATILLPVCYWIVVEKAATDNIVELMRDNGSILSGVCLFAYVLLIAASATVIALNRCLLPRRRLVAWALVTIGAPLGYALLGLGLEDMLVKYGKVFSAMQFLLSSSREAYAAPLELGFRFLIAHAGIVAVGAVCQAPFWTWQRAAHGQLGDR